MDRIRSLTYSISTHGLHSIQFAKNRFQVYFWLLVFAGSLCLLGYNIYSIIQYFSQSPVAVTMKVSRPADENVYNVSSRIH